MGAYLAAVPVGMKKAVIYPEDRSQITLHPTLLIHLHPFSKNVP